MEILELKAEKILKEYTGANNYILKIKEKILNNKNYKISRTQADYIIKYKDVVPKVVKKNVKVLKGFATKIKEENELDEIPDEIWVQKILCETEKAYHIYGNFKNTDTNYCFWIPIPALVKQKKKLKYEVNYDKYSHRPPMNHQKEAIEFLLANDRFILADAPGVGKTSSAVIAALESGAKKVLIICPASLKINWKREIQFYSNKEILIIEDGKWGSIYEFYIINYDILKNYHNLENPETSLILKEKFDLCIVDEAHNISNIDAMRTKLVNDILDNIPKVWLLSGTPITSRPINLYNLLRIVKSPLANNWKNYVIRYCSGFQINIKNSKKSTWVVNGSSNLDELREGVQSVMLRRLKEDILDLPEKIITPIFLELKNRMYEDELDNFIKIDEENKNDETIAIRLNRLMTIRKIISHEKFKISCELAEKHIEMNQKVIIFTNFTSTLEMFKEYFGKKCVVLDGRMTSKNRQISIDEFQNNPNIKVFVSNLKAGGVGITLTASEVTIMNDLSFVPSEHSQAEDRNFRYGVKNNVIIYYPIFDNTIEKIVYNILNKKKNIIDQVMGDGDYSLSFAKELLENIN